MDRAGNLARVTTAAPEPRVLARTDGSVGHLTLNRPRAINALDLGMIRDLSAALDAWEHDPAVELVVLDGAGERGLCAGGDVRGLYDQLVSGDVEATAEFFRAEYALNARIAEYPKPFVALADGITMGGGIGLAGHASIRVVTERSKLAMPETRIGFTPDVGGTWLLAHAPGRLGEYLALTGTTMDAADAVFCGFADHVVASEELEALRATLRQARGPGVAGPSSPGLDTALRAYSTTGGNSRAEAARAWVDDAFAADTVPEIIERLRARPEAEASATVEVLEELSPTALTVTLAAVRRARELPDLRAALAQEYGLVMWFGATQPDLVEGIRAQLVDKDRSPRWSPATLADLDPEVAASALSFVPARALWD